MADNLRHAQYGSSGVQIDNPQDLLPSVVGNSNQDIYINGVLIPTIKTYTWASKPNPVDYVGYARLTGLTTLAATLTGGAGSLWYSNGVSWELVGGSTVLWQQNRSYTAPADTNEYLAIDDTLFGGVMGANSRLKLSVFLETNSSAGTKTFRCKLGAAVWFAPVITTTVATQIQHFVNNVNSLAAQNSFPAANGGVGAQSGSAISTYAVNTAIDLALQFTIQKNAGGDTAIAHAVTLELYR